MRHLKLVLAYDGSAYAGWQVQLNEPTVQAALETALHSVTGETIRPVASGRTDAGVHALGQVVSLATGSHLSCEVLLRALNANLPEDIVVLNVDEAPDGFNAIAHAIRKRYRYLIHDGRLRDPLLRHYVWHVFRPLDEAAMQRAAERLLGKHDFACFQSAGSPRASTVRTIGDLTVCRHAVCPMFLMPRMAHIDLPQFMAAEDAGGAEQGRGAASGSRHQFALQPTADGAGQGRGAALDRSQTRLIIEVEADGFLYNMVRNIVGTLFLVGRGEQSETWIDDLLAARDRTLAGPTAPPQGLFLVSVDYE